MSSNIHDLDEYRLACLLVKEMPKLFKSLDKCNEALVQYNHYIDVVEVIWTLNENRMILEAKYDYYKRVYEKGAKRDD